MSETLLQIVAIGQENKFLVSGLTILCALMFLHLTESRALTFFFMPVAAFGALVGIWVSRELGFYYSTDPNSNVLMSSLLGLIISLGIVFLVARASYMVLNVIRSRQTERLRDPQR